MYLKTILTTLFIALMSAMATAQITELKAGESLKVGQYLVSKNGVYSFGVNDEGKLERRSTRTDYVRRMNLKSNLVREIKLSVNGAVRQLDGSGKLIYEMRSAADFKNGIGTAQKLTIDDEGMPRLYDSNGKFVGELYKYLGMK